MPHSQVTRPCVRLCGIYWLVFKINTRGHRGV
ncbi:hypothetical protein F383_29572 [Gossypium arboreum]|uniref:Uncharacterized protein n=1 Tax=Gossypium arboreum TaxID=29729 RepID=A0A0B0MYG2_GOSAR|nr:hypothetical protein F383_29572 [Gossypium arboreum]